MRSEARRTSTSFRNRSSGAVSGWRKVCQTCLRGKRKLLEHHLSHQDGRERPLPGDVGIDHLAPMAPLLRQPADLPFDHVEPPGGVPRHPMGVG